MTPHFHDLFIKRIRPETAGAVVITLAVPPDLRDAFAFRPGQFLTLRASIDGVAQRRSYSICSSVSRLARQQEIDIGIKRVEGGVFSTWATTQLAAGDTLAVMPPEGRFTPHAVPVAGQPLQRVGFAAGSGITPLLSIIATLLDTEADSHFTLVYGNQQTSTIMFNEALQDLKDSQPARLSLIQLLSRQQQDTAIMNGRIDADHVNRLLQAGLLAPGGIQGIDEVFICGPEGMIDATEQALHAAGMDASRIRTERFFAADNVAPVRRAPQDASVPAGAAFELEVVMDGKTHKLGMGADDHVLDAALAVGLDLPYSCKGGVCCTCRARVMEGQVTMDKNFTLEPWEIAKGFVLTCQSRPVTPRVVVSYDER